MIVTRWTGAKVLALREVALRMRREPFAQKIGVFESTVRKWERATEQRPVMAESAEALDTVLAQLTDDQQARFRAALDEIGTPSVPTVAPVEVAEGDEVKRRQFGFAVGAALLASSSSISRVGLQDARRLAERVSSLERSEQAIGGAALVHEGISLLEFAKAQIDTATFDDRAGREYLSAAGNLATIVGWLAHDAEQPDLARWCYNEAFSMADQAGDPELTVHTCLNLAHLTIHLSRTGEPKANPHRALNLVSRARDLTSGRPPGRIHALIATREAQAQAVIGDGAAFARAIATAWRELDFALEHEPTGECPPWMHFVSATEVRCQEARGFGDLGQFKKSADLSAGLAVEHAGARNAANYRAGWCAALARVGDLNGAVAVGLLVLDDLEGAVSSTRTLRLLQPVRDAAVDHPENFSARFDKLLKRTVQV
ncbi:hypothetical protein ACFVMC_08745 [Nocardia sp. NPDC127579]|uniref:hypothetical protein n=1 Tax=Nocardia sp. NPDC127579 TaxID=3345402 RepID=UPI0036429BF5